MVDTFKSNWIHRAYYFASQPPSLLPSPSSKQGELWGRGGRSCDLSTYSYIHFSTRGFNHHSLIRSSFQPTPTNPPIPGGGVFLFLIFSPVREHASYVHFTPDSLLRTEIAIHQHTHDHDGRKRANFGSPNPVPEATCSWQLSWRVRLWCEAREKECRLRDQGTPLRRICAWRTS